MRGLKYMEIPGYEDTFFDNIPEDIKTKFYEGKREFEQTRDNNIARSEEFARKSRLNSERGKFISHCIKLRERLVHKTDNDESGEFVVTVDKTD